LAVEAGVNPCRASRRPHTSAHASSTEALYRAPAGPGEDRGRAEAQHVERRDQDQEGQLAITGGTGRYVGAAGETVLTELPDGTGTVVFTLARR